MKKKLLRIPDAMVTDIRHIMGSDYWEGATMQTVIIDLLAKGIAWHKKKESRLKKAVLEVPSPNTIDQASPIIDETTRKRIEIAKTPWVNTD